MKNRIIVDVLHILTIRDPPIRIGCMSAFSVMYPVEYRNLPSIYPLTKTQDVYGKLRPLISYKLLKFWNLHWMEQRNLSAQHCSNEFFASHLVGTNLRKVESWSSNYFHHQDILLFLLYFLFQVGIEYYKLIDFQTLSVFGISHIVGIQDTAGMIQQLFKLN